MVVFCFLISVDTNNLVLVELTDFPFSVLVKLRSCFFVFFVNTKNFASFEVNASLPQLRLLLYFVFLECCKLVLVILFCDFVN